jgi:hypothetical protein
MATNTIWQQSEVVRKKMFPLWMEADYGVLSDFIMKGEQERVGERDYRIPFQQTFGGRAGHYDPQLGDMGRGSSPTGNVLLQSFFSFRLNFEFDELQIAATENKSVAIQNPFTYCVANGMKEMNLIWDKIIHGTGTAFLATSVGYSAATGFSVYTMSDAFGTQLLRRGQYYTVYDSTGNTLKSAGVLWATQVNTQARTLTFSGIVPNAAAGDLIAFEGVSGAQPAGPRGLQYWINQATSGVTAGIDRSLENQVIAKSIDGSNGLSTEAVLALSDRIFKDRGAVPNLLGICSVEQRAYAYSQMIAIQMSLIEGEKANLFDRLPKLKGRKFFMWGENPTYVDIHQDAHKVHYIVPSDWGRAILSPDGFYETPGKSGPDARFIQLYGASGGPAAGVWFGFVRNQDLYTFNPGEQGVIYSLPIGPLYNPTS